ncbi:MAG: DUF1972 domain-containing protein [Bacilli bacterium]|nr:DUF1972 domain-containing protein [Bacilli bacterium]
MKNVFIIGSKGIPAKYGGYETFVEYLTARKINKDIKYHVACLAKDNNEFEHNGARCFNVKVPNIGAAKAVYYDIYALKSIIKYVKENDIKDAIVLILACRIGIVFRKYVRKLHALGVEVIVNPDGHEWKRSKWPWIIKKYWKYSERRMIKYTDRIICDSVNIEKYIHEEYGKYNPKTSFVAYGSDVVELKKNTELFKSWAEKFDLKSDEYYLVVGRFVPENNYEMMIKGYMASNTKKPLVLITNVEKNKFYERLLKSTQFDKDPRVKFVGTVYDQALLQEIRYNAFAYIHGHSVGGTNPSLLEGLACTDLSMLFDVSFNREVGGDTALYFDSAESFTKLIEDSEKLSKEEIAKYAKASSQRIKDNYSWESICSKYEERFYE